MNLPKLIFVRHAHAVWSTPEERTLSERGLADAVALVGTLAAENIAAIYSSPYRRAIQTIEPLAAHLGLEIKQVDDLRERRLGVEVTSNSFEEASKQTWEDFDRVHADGESNRTAQRRGVVATERIIAAHPGETIVIASHGTMITLILRHFDPTIGYEFWCALKSPEMILLERTPERWVLQPSATRVAGAQTA